MCCKCCKNQKQRYYKITNPSVKRFRFLTVKVRGASSKYLLQINEYINKLSICIIDKNINDKRFEVCNSNTKICVNGMSEKCKHYVTM